MTAAAMPAASLATPAARREARRAAAESAAPPAAVPVQPPIVIRRGLLGRPRVIMAPGLVPVPGGIAAAPAAPAPRPAGGVLPKLGAVLPQLGAVLPQLGAVLPQLGNVLPQAGAKPAQAGGAPAQAAVAGNAKPPASTAPAAATPPTAPPSTAAVAESIPAPRPLPMKESQAAAGPTSGADTAAFSPAWFAAHPDAWRPTPPAAEWWKPADVAAITAWLGQGVTRAGGAATAPGRVVTAGGGADNAADDAAVGGDGLRSVLVLPTGRDEPASATDPGNGAAAAEWLPLGVFAVVPPGGDSAANEQQLLVDRTGAIRGTFHDPLSGTVQPVNGVVDLSTRTASWTVGSGGSRFECGLDAFAAAPARVVVTAGGTSRTLDLVPIPGPAPGR